MILKQFLIILTALFLGYALSLGLHLPIPANVIGFALIFAALCAGIIKIHHVDKVSDFIIKYLAIFYVPTIVGIMEYFDLLRNEFFKILVPMTISVLIGLFVAAKVTDLCIVLGDKRRSRKGLGGGHAE